VALIAQLAEMQDLPDEIPAISHDPDDDKFIVQTLKPLFSSLLPDC
jgi:hypothetical protein